MNKLTITAIAKRMVLCIAIVLAVTAGLCGCRPTDALTKTIYADWATEIDYDSPIKNLKNVPGKEQTTALPMLAPVDEDIDKTEERSDPVYDSDSELATTDEPVSEVRYAQDAPDTDDDRATGTNSDKKEKHKGGSPETGDDGGWKSLDDTGDAGEGDSSTGDSENEGSNSETEGKQAVDVGGNDVGRDASRDVFDEPDKQGSVIAFGEVANICALLGGKGALWCADDAFLGKAGDLYGEEFANTVKSGIFTDYSSSSKTLSAKGFKSLCAELDKLDEKSRPVYLVYDGSIGCPLDEEDSQTLQDKYGIEVTYFFLNRTKTLKNSMNYLQKILADTGEYDAEERYRQYWEFHDGLLNDIATANGGVAAWESGTDSPRMSFSDGSSIDGSMLMPEDKMRWTLVVTDWDDDVSYSHEGVTSIGGLAISRLGYLWSPISYYMQCGGVINNAAARYQVADIGFDDKTEYYRYVWQMGLYYYPPLNNSDWNSLKGASLKAEKDRVSNNSDLLMRAQNGAVGLGKYGKKLFPTVVVTDPECKTKIESNYAYGGVYGAHYLEPKATGNNPTNSAIGVAYTGGSAWWSWVGRECGYNDIVEADPAYANTDEPFDVLVNPHGYYSSWIDGSVESVLESVWAYEYLCKPYEDEPQEFSSVYGNTAFEVVTYFYETFYGNAPNIDAVLNGEYAS